MKKRSKIIVAFLVLTIFSLFGTVHSQTASDHFQRGLAASKSGDLPIAISEYTIAIQMDPKNSAAYYNRAIVYEKANEPALALIDLTKSIELKPDRSAAYTNRGNIYARRGDLVLALADHTKVVELDPKSARSFLNRGGTYMQMRQTREALADFDKGAELDPKSANIFNMRGNLHSLTRNWALAITDWDRALELDPSRSELHYQKLWTFLFLNDNERAIAAAKKYLDVKGVKDDRSGWALNAGYLALLRTGNQTAGETLLSQYDREQMPGTFPKQVLQFLRGRLKQPEFMAAAGDDNLKIMAARTYIGEMLLLSNKPEAAVEQFEWVIKNGPKNATEYQLAVAEADRMKKR